LLSVAALLVEDSGPLEQPELTAGMVPGLPESIADLATLVVPVIRAQPEGLSEVAAPSSITSGEPVLATKGVLRVASRFTGDPVDRRNRLTDGRMAVARMVGGGANARAAHLGLIELAAAVCRPVAPKCSDCPLATTCASSEADSQYESHLFRLPV
jgi:DNA (cytosine-5)-methyltransferase 1